MVRSDGGEQEGQGGHRKIVFSASLIPFFNLPSNFLFSFLIESVSCRSVGTGLIDAETAAMVLLTASITQRTSQSPETETGVSR